VSTSGTDHLRFSKDHCWARLEDGGEVTIGLTDFAQAALGTIVFVELPDPGGEVEIDGVLGEVESTKAVSEVYSPVTGRVKAVNSGLTDVPRTINTDPYGAGWLCTIEPFDAGAFDLLLDPSAYFSLTDTAPEA
jgi:glycine cleavage system H protein